MAFPFRYRTHQIQPCRNHEAQEPCKTSQKYQADDQISGKEGNSIVITHLRTESPSSSSFSWHTISNHNLERFWKIAQNSEWKTFGTKKKRTNWRHEKTEYFTWSSSLEVIHPSIVCVGILYTHTFLVNYVHYLYCYYGSKYILGKQLKELAFSLENLQGLKMEDIHKKENYQQNEENLRNEDDLQNKV